MPSAGQIDWHESNECLTGYCPEDHHEPDQEDGSVNLPQRLPDRSDEAEVRQVLADGRGQVFQTE